MSKVDKEARVLFRVIVNKHILKRFKEAIVHEHGDLYGKVELETNNALEAWAEKLRGGE